MLDHPSTNRGSGTPTTYLDPTFAIPTKKVMAAAGNPTTTTSENGPPGPDEGDAAAPIPDHYGRVSTRLRPGGVLPISTDRRPTMPTWHPTSKQGRPTPLGLATPNHRADTGQPVTAHAVPTANHGCADQCVSKDPNREPTAATPGVTYRDVGWLESTGVAVKTAASSQTASWDSRSDTHASSCASTPHHGPKQQPTSTSAEPTHQTQLPLAIALLVCLLAATTTILNSLDTRTPLAANTTANAAAAVPSKELQRISAGTSPRELLKLVSEATTHGNDVPVDPRIIYNGAYNSGVAKLDGYSSHLLETILLTGVFAKHFPLEFAMAEGHPANQYMTHLTSFGLQCGRGIHTVPIGPREAVKVFAPGVCASRGLLG